MFQHVTVLVSFIFAIALTHVFSSASQLLLARDRVRFSALRMLIERVLTGQFRRMPSHQGQTPVIFS